jgi:mannose-6-phosphate isomerase-like protein (cupin superfamily)
MADGVKLISTLYNTGEVRVAEFSIDPVSVGSVHFHNHVNELCVCLEGQMLVHQQGLPSVSLRPGQRTTIPAGVVHTVENPVNETCKYMVVQGPGKYDLVRLNPAAE